MRNDRPIEAIVAAPDPDWFFALWRTVVPDFELGLTYRACEEAGEYQ